MTLRLPPCPCPYCNAVHDSVTQETNQPITPSDGDYSLCWSCGEWTIWKRGRLRKPTATEFYRIQNDKHLRSVKMAWTLFKTTPMGRA